MKNSYLIYLIITALLASFAFSNSIASNCNSIQAYVNNQCSETLMVYYNTPDKGSKTLKNLPAGTSPIVTTENDEPHDNTWVSIIITGETTGKIYYQGTIWKNICSNTGSNQGDGSWHANVNPPANISIGYSDSFCLQQFPSYQCGQGIGNFTINVCSAKK